MPMEIKEGDVLELKKAHPCGGKNFEVLRTGMDFRIKCLVCGSQVWISRAKLEKKIKKVSKNEHIGDK